MFAVILNSLLPVFGILLLGVFLSRIGMITLPVQQGLNKIAYWVGLPALLFIKISEAPIEGSAANRMLVVIVLATACTLLVAFCAGKILKLEAPSRSAFMHASFRGNLAFLALPVIFFMAETLDPLVSDRLLTTVILAMAPMVIAYNLVAVPILVLHSPRDGHHPLKDLVHRLVTNPLIIACVLGFAVNLLRVPLPTFLSSTCSSLGAAAFPMALMAIGSHLSRARLGENLVPPVTAAVFKTMLTPFIAYLVARHVELSVMETRAALIMCASPTAVASYVLTDQLGGDSELNAATIAISSVIAFFTFAAVMVVPL